MKKQIKKMATCAFYIGALCGILFGMTACAGADNAGKGEQKTESNMQEKTNVAISKKYPNANDRMVYLPLDDGTVEQWSLDGTYQKSFSLPTEEMEEDDLLWVGNEEMLWCDCDFENEKDTIYSIPIRQTKSGEELVIEDKKKLFTFGDEYMDSICGGSGGYLGTAGQVYADEDNIIFMANFELYRYDRKKGNKPEKIDTGDDYPFISHYALSLSSQIAGNQVIYHTGRESGKIEENAYGFWIYTMGQKQSERIDDRCFSDAAYVADSAHNKVYYQIIDDQSIWEYDCGTGERKELITEAQFQQCFENNQLKWDEPYYKDSLFVEENTVYYVRNHENPQIFSYSLTDGVLSYEKELTAAVQRSGYCEAADYSNVRLMILEGKVLLYWDGDGDLDEDFYVCIDISTAEMKEVTQKDSEKIYFGMIGAWEKPGTTGDWKPRERKESDKKGQREASLDISNQLALIGDHVNTWMKETKEEEEITEQYITVTDLDQDGRLELIMSTGGQGSGHFTHSMYYQVSADGTCLRRIHEEFAEADIVDGIKIAYVDTKTNLYYYMVSDYCSGGAGARYNWYAGMVLKNNMLTARHYASSETTWDEQKKEEKCHYYRFADGKKKKISAKKFDLDKLAHGFFAGCQKKKVNMSWFHVNTEERMTKKEINKRIEKSYREFGLEV